MSSSVESMSNATSLEPAPIAQRARWGRAALLAFAIGAFILVPIPLCPLRVYLHVPCPGCGLTRSTFQALQGHMHASFVLHPLTIPTLLLMAPSFLLVLVDTARTGSPQPFPRWLRMIWTCFFVVLFGVWIARFFGAFGGPAPI